jgi:hypothetical protein
MRACGGTSLSVQILDSLNPLIRQIGGLPGRLFGIVGSCELEVKKHPETIHDAGGVSLWEMTAMDQSTDAADKRRWFCYLRHLWMMVSIRRSGLPMS